MNKFPFILTIVRVIHKKFHVCSMIWCWEMTFQTWTSPRGGAPQMPWCIETNAPFYCSHSYIGQPCLICIIAHRGNLIDKSLMPIFWMIAFSFSLWNAFFMCHTCFIDIFRWYEVIQSFIFFKVLLRNLFLYLKLIFLFLCLMDKIYILG